MYNQSKMILLSLVLFPLQDAVLAKPLTRRYLQRRIQNGLILK